MISESLQGTIIGGIIGFGSAIGTDIIKRWLTRPKISISQHTTEVSIVPWPQITSESWIATRIKVENNGNTAADDCKAYLITDNDEFRVAWMIPKDDRTVIINAHDVEYIDLCAFRKTNPSSNTHYDRIFATERGYGDMITEARKLEGVSMNAKLKVSAKNAKRCIKNIKVLNVPDSNNKIVQFQ